VIKPRAFPWRNVKYLAEGLSSGFCYFACFFLHRISHLVMPASPTQCHFDPKPPLGLWFYYRYVPWYKRVYFQNPNGHLLSGYTNFFADNVGVALMSTAAASVLISISAIAAHSSFSPLLDLQAKTRFLLQSTSSLWFMSSTSVYKYVQLYDIHDGNGRYDNIVTVIYVVIRWLCNHSTIYWEQLWRQLYR